MCVHRLPVLPVNLMKRGFWFGVVAATRNQVGCLGVSAKYASGM